MLKINKSRFAVLLEDTSQIIEMSKPVGVQNSPLYPKNDKPKYTKRHESYKNTNLMIDKNKQIKKTDKQTIAEMSFPVLENSKMNTTKNLDCDSFINKLKTQNIELSRDEEDIPIGWVKICRDKNTNHIQILYNENDKCNKQDIIIENEVSVTNMMTNLSELHKKRENEYIDMWGIDDWEKEFMFKNTSYNYNDSDSESEYEYY
jgi:hypothetical protein